MTASNELNITGGKVDATKAVSGKKIKVTAGEVDFTAATGVLGSDTTDLITISGGTIDAKTAAGAIKGKTIKFEKGDIKATNVAVLLMPRQLLALSRARLSSLKRATSKLLMS